MSSDKRSTPLVFTPLSSEDMLPDERKKIVRKMQAVIHDAGLEPVLIDKLPIDEDMKYAEVPLETVPLITALTEDEATAQNVTQPTAADVAESTAKRASLVVSNAKKAEARTAKLNGYKEQIGNAILNMLEANCSQLATQYRNAHELRAEGDVLGATYDGVAMFKAFKNATNHNDPKRQGEEASTLMTELGIQLPDNATSAQMAQIWNRFSTEVDPYLERPMTNTLRVRWLLDRMPASLREQKDIISYGLRTHPDGNKLDDVGLALIRCREACDNRHDPALGAPDVAAALAAHKANLLAANLVLLGHSAPSPASPEPKVNFGKGKGRGGRGEQGGRGGSRGGKRDERVKWVHGPIPASYHGGKCWPDQSCNVNHQGWCISSHKVNGTCPAGVWEDKAAVKQIEDHRKQQVAALKAKGKDAKYTPLLPFVKDGPRLQHVDHPGKSYRQAGFTPPPNGAAKSNSAVVPNADDEYESDDDDDGDSDAWRQLVNCGQFFSASDPINHGGYMFFDHSKFGDLDPVAPTKTKWYAVAGGPKHGVHGCAQTEYNDVIRPHVDGVRDLLGAVRCQSASSEAEAQALLSRLEKQRTDSAAAVDSRSKVPLGIPLEDPGRLAELAAENAALKTKLEAEAALKTKIEADFKANNDALKAAAEVAAAARVAEYKAEEAAKAAVVIQPPDYGRGVVPCGEATAMALDPQANPIPSCYPPSRGDLPLDSGAWCGSFTSPKATVKAEGVEAADPIDPTARFEQPKFFTITGLAPATPESWANPDNRWYQVDGSPEYNRLQSKIAEDNLKGGLAELKCHGNGHKAMRRAISYVNDWLAKEEVNGGGEPDWVKDAEVPATPAQITDTVFRRVVWPRLSAAAATYAAPILGLFLLVVAASAAFALFAPTAVPASFALVAHSALSRPQSSLGMATAALGLHFDDSLIPSLAPDRSTAQWAGTAAVVALTIAGVHNILHYLYWVCRLLGAAVLACASDIASDDVASASWAWTTLTYHVTMGRVWDAVKRLCVKFYEMSMMFGMLGILGILGVFLSNVAPVGGTPSHRQFNGAAAIMQSLPLLQPGAGLHYLDAFTRSKFNVSVSCPATSSQLSEAACYDLSVSLGLVCSPDGTCGHDAAALEGGEAYLNDFAYFKSKRGVTSFKSECLNIWDSGASCGNFTSLMYAVPGTVRVNSTKISTASGLYTPPKTFDAQVPVESKLGTDTKIQKAFVRGSFENPQCPHNLIPPGLLAREQGVATWIAPFNERSYIQFPDRYTTTIINAGILILPDASTPCEPIHHAEFDPGNGAPWLPEASPSFSPSAVAASSADMETLCPSITVGDQGFTKNVDGKCIHRRINHRDPKILQYLPRCTDAPDDWKEKCAAELEHGLPCDPCLRGTSKCVPSKHHVPKFGEPGDCVSFDIYKLSTAHRYGGQRNIIRFRDLASRGYGRSYLLKRENECSRALEHFHAWCGSKGVKVLRYHTDNAASFAGEVGDTCRNAARKLDAHFTTIAPGVPRQNGLSEHDWSVLGKDVRNMIACGRMPKNLCWYVWQQAEEVAACIPFKNDPDNCQYRLFHKGTRPHIAKFRPPGCLCYMKLLTPLGKVVKETEQAVRCIHLCRCRDQPGYHCLDPATGRVHVACHVRFVEDEFPGLTLTKNGSEQVVPSFADDYDPKARRTKHPTVGDESWHPLEPLPPWEVVPGGPHSTADDQVSPSEGESDASVDDEDGEAPTPSKSYGPSPGERVSERTRGSAKAKGAHDGGAAFRHLLAGLHPHDAVHFDPWLRHQARRRHRHLR